jgi:putative peptidoglycan lipid II flippase
VNAVPSLMSSTVARSSAVMALGTLVSRVLGMVRALLLAWALGLLALSANAFATANTVPNSVYMLLAGGIFNAVLVPELTRAAKDSDGGQGQLDRLFTLAVLGLVAVTAVVVLLAPMVPTVLARQFDDDTAALTIAFAYWCLPQVFFYGLYAVFGQVLNARGVFGPFTWAPVANNVVALGGLTVFLLLVGPSADRAPGQWTEAQIALLAGSATLGVAVQALILIVPLRRAGISFRLRFTGLAGEGRLGKIAGWTLGTAVISQAAYVVTSNVSNAAGTQGQAGRTVYDNAYTLIMLPHSLLTVSLVTVLFTQLSRAAAANDRNRVGRDLSQALRIIGAGTVFAATALVALAPDLSQALYPGNAPREVDALAGVLRIMALAVVPLSAQHLLQRGFYAFQDARTPFFIQIPVVTISAAVAVTGWLVLPPHHVVEGVALGLAVGLSAGAVLSAVVLHRRLDGLDLGQVAWTYARLTAAGVIAGLATTLAESLVTTNSQGYLANLVSLVASACLLLLTYTMSGWLLRIPEMRSGCRIAARWIRRDADG